MSNRRICDVSRWINEVISDPTSRPTPHAEEDFGMWEALYKNKEFVDDMNGFTPLDKQMTIQARKLEIEYFRKMKVYTKVPRSEALRGGYKIITTKWLDTNKGDDEKPNYRSRLVGRELNTEKRLDLFAATPPLETIKFLIAQCAQHQNHRDPWRVAVFDVKRAYFYAPATRPIYIEIPKEDKNSEDQGMVGRLELSLYGTRDAAMNWSIEYSSLLKRLGFKQGKASPCNFILKNMNLSVTVHGDDFLTTGPLSSLRWMEKQMKAKYDIKSEFLGPGSEGCAKEVKMLGRVMRWTEEGIEYEPDQRHAELFVRELGLCSSRSVSTPGVSDPRVKEPSENDEVEYNKDELMNTESATKYRGLAARLNYLALDRADVQFAAKECCRYMSSPKLGDWERLKRVGRYLRGRPRSVQRFPFECQAEKLSGFADSDWAGERPGMKSTSGGAIFLGRSMIKSWSSSQTVIALSSGEAELYALMRLTTQILGLISLAADFDLEYKAEVQTDSSAAMGIASRTGLGGKSRHINVQYLWIQNCIKSETISLHKVGTECNIADAMTKHLGREAHEKFITAMGYFFIGGRAEESRKINGLKLKQEAEEGCKKMYSKRHVNIVTTPRNENRVRHRPQEVRHP